MQFYTELTPPTAVTHSLSLPFLSPSANNLIVAKTSLLQIFSIKSIITDISNGPNSRSIQTPGRRQRDDVNGPESAPCIPGTIQRAERVHTTKLILVAQFELSGTIISLARIKILRSKSGGEALLVALRDAKLSLVEWDPERYSISTISIHYYEREDLQGSPWDLHPGQSINYLSVDPSCRCAALKFGARQLAILPFHQAGDDLVMDDYDPELDVERPEPTPLTSKTTDGASLQDKTPYAASFVLSLLALDPNLSHPLHLAFLHEYREPTFGILSSQVASSTALLHERRDILSYSVFTLDLEQRASTALLSVSSLPYDLFAVLPLPLPVGGALLVGGNELIHVDQAGKTNGVAINEFAKHSTAFAMLDQSNLDLRLENCVIEQLGFDNREMLIVLKTGELAILDFKTDGRSVSGLSVRRVAPENGGDVLLAGASCATVVGRGRMFLGSENADSAIIGWSRKSVKLKRQKSRVDMDFVDMDDASEVDEDVDDDDDDLYSGAKTDEVVPINVSSTLSTSVSDGYMFRIHDVLQNCGPMKDIAFGRPLYQDEKDHRSSSGTSLQHEMVVTSGTGKAGGITTFQREVDPSIAERYDIADAQGIWTVRSKRTGNDSTKIGMKADKTKNEYDTYIITTKATEIGEAQSSAYSLISTGLEDVKDTDFDPDAGATVEVGTLNGGTRIIQVLAGELRTFDGDFGLAQIFPMTDDVTGAEPKVVSASFADPYVQLIRDDASVMVLKADESGDLDEVEMGDALLGSKWLSGSLYEDSNDTFRLEWGDDSDDEVGNVLMFLLGAGGGLQIFRLPKLQQPVYVADGLGFLPPFLSTEFVVRRSSARETLTEILVADLGDSNHRSPYLILRSASDDLIIYQPYQSPLESSPETSLRFLKISNPHLPKMPDETLYDDDQETRNQPLRAIHEVGDYSAVFLPGTSPSFIFKAASSPPLVVPLKARAVRSLSRFHTAKCEKGFVYIDGEGTVSSAQLPFNSQYSTGWVTCKIPLGEEIQALDYHAGMDSYVIGSSHLTDFKLPDDDFHNDGSTEDALLPPQVDQGSIKLLDRESWSIIDTYNLDPTEVVMCIETMSLEISEHTHLRQELVAIGTALMRGEDLPSQGRVYIFDIIDVVPEPDRPVTGHKFKLVAKEEVKGAVTSLSEIGTQGFLLVAQGQKCMVRGLKEDGTLLPVAFMDMQCYVSVARELKGTGLCVMGDPLKGVWFTGYTEEPYQLRLFGKSPQHIEVIAADFLPDGQQLYIVVADSDCNIHIFQFDPENPKSLSGQRLLHHTTFHTGAYPSTLTLLPPATNLSPSTQTPSSTNSSPHHPQPLLLTSLTGSLSLLTSLPVSTQRTLSALQSHLQNTLPHPLGLNPRMYRSGRAEAEGMVGGRGSVIDGMVVRRWMEGGSWRRWGEGEGEVRGILGGLMVGS